MVKTIITQVLKHRHYWRYVSFDELSELYTSMMLRSLGLSLIGIFVPIYLYKLDYTLATIFIFMAGISLVRLFFNPLAGYLVAYVGPKHVMIGSMFAQIISLILLLVLPLYSLPLWVIAVAWGIAVSLFFISYHVDFSKIMHFDHGGKELGYMTILERMGAALGPVTGGIIATVFGPEYTIAFAVGLFVLAVIPLCLSAEPTLTRQRVYFKGIPYRRLWRDFTSIFMLGADNTIALGVWPLFLAVTLFATNTYASIGLLTSIGIVAAILAARYIGQLIDHQKGSQLLSVAVRLGGAVHLIRPFVSSIGGVALVNITHDAATTGYRMPFVKGMYSRADSLSGFRVAYIVMMENMLELGRVCIWLLLLALSVWVEAEVSMQIGFIVAAFLTWAIAIQRFPALKRSLL